MLTIKGLKKKFGQQVIAENFDLTMKEGEITLLVGQSGSGKTTILRIINGLETADSGDIEFNGASLIQDGQLLSAKDRAKYQQQVGMVFQDYQLFPNMTVMENVTFAPSVNKIGTRQELEKQALEWLQRFNLGDKAQAYPSTLSGGQKQRVAIIRAMMMKPRLLCFDEPTAALDLGNSQEFAAIVKDISKDGTMVLVVTHDLGLVGDLSDQANIIESKAFVS